MMGLCCSLRRRGAVQNCSRRTISTTQTAAVPRPTSTETHYPYAWSPAYVSVWEDLKSRAEVSGTAPFGGS